MTVSAEKGTCPNLQSTKSRNSVSSISRGSNSTSDFGLIWICTVKFEVLDLVEFGGVAIYVESVGFLIFYAKGPNKQEILLQKRPRCYKDTLQTVNEQAHMKTRVTWQHTATDMKESRIEPHDDGHVENIKVETHRNESKFAQWLFRDADLVRIQWRLSIFATYLHYIHFYHSWAF